MTAAMKLIIFLLLIELSEAGVLKIPLTGHRSKQNQMIKDGTLENYVKENRTLQHDNDTQRSIFFMANLADYFDAVYVANLSFGYDYWPQSFRVLLDTGSSDLWISDISCDNCISKNRYNSSKPSKTETWSISYGDGDSATGFLNMDYVNFNGAVNGGSINTTFGRATHSDADSHFYDGILGLAFQSLSHFQVDGKTASPFLYSAVEQKIIDKLMFTVYFQKRGYQSGVPGGFVTLGGIDTENCSPNITYHKLTSSKYFEFEVDSVSIETFNSSVGWRAISDTGTGLIRGPKEIVDDITEAVNATFDPKNNIFSINCSATFDDLKFKIGGLEYTVPSKNLIIERGNGNCWFGINYQTMAFHWTFGVPWIRSYCNVYNLEDESIGFAEPKPY